MMFKKKHRTKMLHVMDNNLGKLLGF